MDSNSVGLVLLAIACMAAGTYVLARARHWPRPVRYVALGVVLVLAASLIMLVMSIVFEFWLDGFPE